MIFWQNIFFAFWFFLPAGLANLFASFAGKIPVLRDLNYPMDCYLNLRGRRIFGPHKTIRGLVIGIITGMLVAFFQGNAMILGLLLGVGAILGDAVKSFAKRQLDIAPGHSFLFFDQIDYILGGILFSIFYVHLTTVQYVCIVLVYFLLHLISNVVGYWLRLKDRPI